jgi:hypothetical protein
LLLLWCNPSAQVASRAATYHGLGGDISNALRITYSSTCNFSGLQEETFAAGIGLLQRIENVGTAQFDFLQARVNGVSATLQKALAFEISVDRACTRRQTLQGLRSPPDDCRRICAARRPWRRERPAL